MTEMPMTLALTDTEIEEVAHRVCRYSDTQTLNFYTLKEQIKNVLKERAAAEMLNPLENTDHVGRDLDDIPQPYAGAIVLLETISECGAKAYVGRERTANSELCIKFANDLRAEARRVVQQATEVQKDEALDLRKIHASVLTLRCDPNASREQQFGFQSGVHRAATVVSGFSDPALRASYESSLAVSDVADAVVPPFGRFHIRRYPDGSRFTFETHDNDPDSFFLYAEPVPELATLDIDTRVLFRNQVALTGWSKRLCSSEDCSDIPAKLKEAAHELGQLRTVIVKQAKHKNQANVIQAGLADLIRFECVTTPDGKGDMYVHPTGPYVWFEHVESLVAETQDDPASDTLGSATAS